jgi:hypothetical protein
MLAKDLKTIINKLGLVTVRIGSREVPNAQGNLSDFGASVAGISTYLQTGMKADIVDAMLMPPMPNMMDCQDYHNTVVQGMVYFVFQHGQYRDHNEPLASTNWTNDRPKDNELPEGTAIQVGCYSGFDMVGFDPDEDISDILITVVD